MPKAKFKVVDNGYGIRKDYVGFGWKIEGNEGGMYGGFDNWLIKVNKKVFDSVETVNNENMMKIKDQYGNYLGFRNITSAKNWAEQNPKQSFNRGTGSTSTSNT